ncbi:hypothetical protein GCM10023187_01250 [Nibrella viscosa]|uniref:Cupin type-2 domain-containing protein n=1 Tax=Nibrella viscosa TaxID=1084524 RepID=A0ABP8JRI9_9BACT
MKFLLPFWVVVCFTSPAFSQALASAVYSWQHSPVTKQAGYEERTLLHGSTSVMADLTIQAITVQPHSSPQSAQELDEEVIVLVKSGELNLTLGSKQKLLGAGSAVLIMPGDPFRLANTSKQPLTYYFIRFMSNEVPDLDLYRLMGQSFWVDYQHAPYEQDGQGGSRRMMDCATVMCRRLTLCVTTLSPGITNQPPHTHPAAEVMILLDNTAQVQLNGQVYQAKTGDVIFMESQAAHTLHPPASGSCTYVSLHFE